MRSSGGDVIRLSNVLAASGTGGVTATTILSGGCRHVGMDSSGNLLVNKAPRLMKSTNPRASVPDFTNVGDFAFSAISTTARSMHVAGDDAIYLAENGRGVIKGVLTP
jgi:hypothetical protein